MDRIRYVLDLQGAQSESRFRTIGRYSLNLAQAMARTATDHEMWIALNGRFLDTIDPLRARFDGLVPQERIVTFDVPGPVAEADAANAWRRGAAEHLREHFLAGLAPDVVHVSSVFEGFGDDAVTSIGTLDSSCPTTATLYDLVPLLLPEQHLSTPAIKHSYLRKLQWLKRADLLLATSESSRQEAIEALHVPAERVVNISTGVDEQFRVLSLSPDETAVLRERYGIRCGFVLYSGEFDSQANVEGLIDAFALLPASVRSNHQLVMVGKLDNGCREQIQRRGRRAGLQSNEIILPGPVEDADLVALYNLCALFAWPSLDARFDLSVLEAMACGAPAVASNLARLREAVGMDDALFDPQQPAAIAGKMQDVLTNESFREALNHNGLRHCQKFTWGSSATTVWRALEELHQRQKPIRESALPSRTTRRPRMAYFSPLPPERSGISDYSAELLPELARFYDIEVVVQQESISDDWIKANFPVRDSAYFENRAAKYDRILYHIGNSPFHVYMFDLLRRYPGCVVLHDFYLGHVLHWMEIHGGFPGYFSRAIFESHGYWGLLQKEEHRSEWAKRTLPCSLGVIEAAAGVIVHSEFSHKLAIQWYGAGMASNWKRVPFLRASRPSDRSGARVRLGIALDAYVVCSFGILGPAKLNDRLLSAWLNSSLAKDNRCQLVFVGEDNSGQFENQLHARIRRSAARKRIHITGFAPPAVYRDYLAAADCAAQLRTDSRGETSAALLDCLVHGLPTIITSNGSFAEVPGNAVIKLAEAFTDKELSEALGRLYSDVEYRRELGQAGGDLARLEHHPARIGELYHDAIESFAMSHPIAREQRVLSSIAALESRVAPAEEDLLEAASSIAMQRRVGPRQLLLDVSATAKHDLKTGIERVARSLVLEFIQNPGGFRVEPVRNLDGRSVYARHFGLNMINSWLELQETRMEFRSGDVYLALDWCSEAVFKSRALFASLRARNVPIHFVIYDILPMVLPQMFPDWAVDNFRHWLDIVCEFSDGLACISRSGADELLSWLDIAQPPRLRPLKIGYFHLGADFPNRSSSKGLPPDADALLASLRQRPSILMVGTIEPRKGHALALSAFEQLWANGVEANLVIVGKQGWDESLLVDRLRAHPQLGKRLIRLSDVSDEMLTKLYDGSTALLAASEDEGFGLPLIEAARHKLPIIARDIAVFREVAGDNAFYFEGKTPHSLASDLRTWLELHKQGNAPSSQGLRCLSWSESAQQLVEVLSGQRIYREWAPQQLARRQLRSAIDENKAALSRSVSE